MIEPQQSVPLAPDECRTSTVHGALRTSTGEPPNTRVDAERGRRDGEHGEDREGASGRKAVIRVPRSAALGGPGRPTYSTTLPTTFPDGGARAMAGKLVHFELPASDATGARALLERPVRLEVQRTPAWRASSTG